MLDLTVTGNAMFGLVDNALNSITHMASKVNNMIHTVHIHNYYKKENIDNEGEINIIGCTGCSHLWVNNTRLPQHDLMVEMDWELADMLIKFHPTSKFSKFYADKVPDKWCSYQNIVYPAFNKK